MGITPHNYYWGISLGYPDAHSLSDGWTDGTDDTLTSAMTDVTDEEQTVGIITRILCR